jgi:hypothetical protein
MNETKRKEQRQYGDRFPFHVMKHVKYREVSGVEMIRK